MVGHFTIWKMFCKLNIFVHIIFFFCLNQLFLINCIKIIPKLCRNTKD